MSKKLKILVWDIETLPHKILGYAWDAYTFIKPVDYKIVEMSNIATIAYKWYGTKTKPTVLKVDPKNPRDDLKILKEFSKVVEQADYMVAHYGDKFDAPYFNARLFINKLPPMPTAKQLDTYKMAKNNMAVKWSNRLDYLAKLRGHEGKSKAGWDLWQGTMDGNASALNKLGKYNAQDIIVLENLFRDLLPYSKVKLIHKNEQKCCDSCGSSSIIKRGVCRTLTKIYTRLSCNDCGRWFKGDIIRED